MADYSRVYANRKVGSPYTDSTTTSLREEESKHTIACIIYECDRSNGSSLSIILPNTLGEDADSQDAESIRGSKTVEEAQQCHTQHWCRKV